MLTVPASNATQHFLMYSLMMTALGSKHVAIIKKILCFGGLLVTLTSESSGIYLYFHFTSARV
jgi:hypothetical protein